MIKQKTPYFSCGTVPLNHHTNTFLQLQHAKNQMRIERLNALTLVQSCFKQYKALFERRKKSKPYLIQKKEIVTTNRVSSQTLCYLGQSQA